MSVSNDLLRRIGEALAGPHWQAPLARDLSVADRTMRRWLAGEYVVPDGVWEDLEGRLIGRREQCLALEREVAQLLDGETVG